jgi:hypothetical protein
VLHRGGKAGEEHVHVGAQEVIQAVLWRKRHPREPPAPAGNRREHPGLFGNPNEARREGACGVGRFRLPHCLLDHGSERDLY